MTSTNLLNEYRTLCEWLRELHQAGCLQPLQWWDRDALVNRLARIDVLEQELIETPFQSALGELVVAKAAQTYTITRIYQDRTKPVRTVRSGLSLAEAEAHCSDPRTSNKEWMDVYCGE